ncbi:AcrR family transcriptional regulator [Mumia flava]|uniref:AcrR family transcriptional regulator n=1 Tax=Mumia flava TaxID=1348852 RepID=A0A0B2BK20_9ACTN|nr:TetR family transcriptional regulator [Mumia flava]PJJ57175.1 AcrR family transcriptional regulator [Mumia flava]
MAAPQTPTTSRPRSAEATKQAILDAARTRFTTEGYRRATVRAVAADAGIDPAMVMRYFGSKQQLFAAAADLDLRLPELSRVARSRRGHQLVTHFVARWEDPDDDTLLMLLRAAIDDEQMAETMHRMFAEQLVATIVSVLPDERMDEAPRRAGLIATQMLGLALCRDILRLPPVVALSPAAAVASIAPTVQRYLTAPLPDAD